MECERNSASSIPALLRKKSIPNPFYGGLLLDLFYNLITILFFQRCWTLHSFIVLVECERIVSDRKFLGVGWCVLEVKQKETRRLQHNPGFLVEFCHLWNQEPTGVSFPPTSPDSLSFKTERELLWNPESWSERDRSSIIFQ